MRPRAGNGGAFDGGLALVDVAAHHPPLLAAHLAAGAVLAFAFSMLEVSDSLILAQRAEHFPITKATFALMSALGDGPQLAAALGVWSMVFLSASLIGAALLNGRRSGLGGN